MTRISRQQLTRLLRGRAPILPSPASTPPTSMLAKVPAIVAGMTGTPPIESEKPVRPRVRKVPRLPGGGMTDMEAWAAAVSFHVSLTPQPKERARTYADSNHLIRAFRAARGDVQKFMAVVKKGLMRTVTPDSTRVYEAAIASAASAEMCRRGVEPFCQPVRMLACFIFEGKGEEWPTAAADGDLDNLEKALLDGLNKVVWTDDRLVVDKHSCKRTGAKAGIHVTVWPVHAASAPENGSTFIPWTPLP